MFKPPADVILSKQRQGFHQSVSEFSLCSSLEGAEGSFEFGNKALKGIEVRRVRWEMHDIDSRRFDQLDRLGRIMKLDVVEQDEVPRAQAGDEEVLDVQLKDLRVDGPFNRHGGTDAFQPQRTNHRN